MSTENIGIVLQDQIQSTIQTKIEGIAIAAEVAYSSIVKLQQSLSQIASGGLGSLASSVEAVASVQERLSRTNTDQVRLNNSVQGSIASLREAYNSFTASVSENIVTNEKASQRIESAQARVVGALGGRISAETRALNSALGLTTASNNLASSQDRNQQRLEVATARELASYANRTTAANTLDAAKLRATASLESSAAREIAASQRAEAASLRLTAKELEDMRKVDAFRSQSAARLERYVQETEAKVSRVAAVAAIDPSAAIGGGLAISGGVARELFVLVRELQSGNVSALSGSLVVLANKAGQATTVIGALTSAQGAVIAMSSALELMGTILTTIINPWTILLGLVTTAGVLFYQHTQDVKNFTAALALTGNVAGITTENFQSMAETIAKSTGVSVRTAKTELLEMAQSGIILSSQFERTGAAAVNLGILTKKSTDESLKDLINLASGGSSAILKLNQQLNFLSVAQQLYVATHTSDAERTKVYGVALEGLTTKFDNLKSSIDKSKSATFDLMGQLGDFVDKLRSGDYKSIAEVLGGIAGGLLGGVTGAGAAALPTAGAGVPLAATAGAMAGASAGSGLAGKVYDYFNPPPTPEQIVPAIRPIFNGEIPTTLKTAAETFKLGAEALLENQKKVQESRREKPGTGISYKEFYDVQKQKELFSAEDAAATAAKKLNEPFSVTSEQERANILADIHKQDAILLDKDQKSAENYANQVERINQGLDDQIAALKLLSPQRREQEELNKITEKFTGQTTSGRTKFELTPEDKSVIQAKVKEKSDLEEANKVLDKITKNSVDAEDHYRERIEATNRAIQLRPDLTDRILAEKNKEDEAYLNSVDIFRQTNTERDNQNKLLEFSGNELLLQTKFLEDETKARREGLTVQQAQTMAIQQELKNREALYQQQVATVRRSYEYEPQKEQLDIKKAGLEAASSGMSPEEQIVEMNKLAAAKENLDLKFKDISGWEAFQVGVEQTLRQTRTSAEEMADIGRTFAGGLNKSFADSAAEALVNGKSFTASFAAAFKQLAATVISELFQMATRAVATQAVLTGSQAGSGAGGAGGALLGIAGFFGSKFNSGTNYAAVQEGSSAAFAEAGLWTTGLAGGGYTGDYPTDQATGIFHGKEFVMNANATAKNRAALEAMNAGMPIGGGSSSRSGAPSITLNNYGTSKQYEVQQLSPTDIRIIARDEIKSSAADWHDPTSPQSRAFSQNYRAERIR